MGHQICNWIRLVRVAILNPSTTRASHLSIYTFKILLKKNSSGVKRQASCRYAKNSLGSSVIMRIIKPSWLSHKGIVAMLIELSAKEETRLTY